MTLPKEENYESTNMKLAQLRRIMFRRVESTAYTQAILQEGFEIDGCIKSTPHLESKHPNLMGCTALHLACIDDRIDSLKVLLKNGIDYTIKNRDGLTALHQVLEKLYEDDSLYRLENELATSILSAHRDSKNFTNPCNNYGLSHFHAACLFNDVELVKSLLENGESVNQSVATNSPVFPGYSPLHFAIRSYCLETVKILIDFGADVNLKNADGKSPLHMLIEQKIRHVQQIRHVKYAGHRVVPADQFAFEWREEILHLLYKNSRNYSDNLSLLQVASAMKDSTSLGSILESDNVDVNLRVAEHSPFWPGYTGLHFAALCSFDNFILLLKYGADVKIVNSAGENAFDMCLKKCKLEDVCRILSSVEIWKEIRLSDNETTLIELVSAFESAEKLKTFFENSPKRASAIVPTDSPIWPGYTILHIAGQIFISDEKILDTFNEYNTDVTAQTINGSTVFHLAFRQQNWLAFDKLWSLHHDFRNLADDKNLTLLHILAVDVLFEVQCPIDVVKRLLQAGVDVNVVYEGKPIGSFLRKAFTPLHVAAATGNYAMAKLLLEYKADCHAFDADGFTPIHWLAGGPYPDDVEMELLSLKDIRECIVRGFSYLHIAACASDRIRSEDQVPAIKGFVKNLLIQPETDINTVVRYDKHKSPSFLKKLDGLTPLGLALQNEKWGVIKLLVEGGADLFMKQPSGSILLRDLVAKNCCYLQNLKDHAKILCRLEKDIGLTKLHFACIMKDMAEIERLLRDREKLNAQIHTDSPIWPGWTPLHILVEFDVPPGPIFELLHKLRLEFDVTLKSAEGETGLHRAYKHRRKNWLNSLFRRINYSENPVNNEGISHFHIACTANKYLAIKNFVQSGQVDINAVVDPFWTPDHVGYYDFPQWVPAGQSPLHLSLIADSSFNKDGASIKVIDFLLKNGAQIENKNIFGETSLHAAARQNETKPCIFRRLIRAGANVNAINVFGESPLHILLHESKFSREQLDIFIDQGCILNAFNPLDETGLISQAFVSYSSEKKDILFDVMRQYPHTMVTDEKGRTILHNLVAGESFMSSYQYVDVINELSMISGCDIEDQDDRGWTALHFAAQQDNYKGVKGLLKIGADVNYLTDYTFKIIGEHVRKLEFLGLYVSEKIKASDGYTHHCFLNNEAIQDEIELSKTYEIISYPSLSLYDFLFEISPKVSSAMRKSQDCINQFFQNFSGEEDFRELQGVLRLQYRKALMRPTLIEEASVALHNLSGCPMDCVESIVALLRNDDLKSLIKADQIQDGCDDL